MNKAFCCWSISNHLNLPYTKATLKGMTLTQLKSLIPETDLEFLKNEYDLYLKKIDRRQLQAINKKIKSLAIKEFNLFHFK